MTEVMIVGALLVVAVIAVVTTVVVATRAGAEPAARSTGRACDPREEEHAKATADDAAD